MNGFELMNATISEQTFTSDELRIIAKDAKGLSMQDREALIRGAEELELANRSLALIYGRLIEREQQLLAHGERPAPEMKPFPTISLNISPVPLHINHGFVKK